MQLEAVRMLFWKLLFIQLANSITTSHSSLLTSNANKMTTRPPTSTHSECSCVCVNTTTQTTMKTYAVTKKPLKRKSCTAVCIDLINGILSAQNVGSSTKGTDAVIFPDFLGGRGVEVYCDCTNGSEEAWTVFQRRIDGSVEFFRNWDDYVTGFGNVSGEFWLGLDLINRFTRSGQFQLRVDLEDWDGNTAYAQYSSFAVGDASTNYTLMVDGYSGSAGDALLESASTAEIANLSPFSTMDRDNDKAGINCAKNWEGAWWFNACFGAHLNGKYYNEGAAPFVHGIIWFNWRGFDYSLKAAEMKFRKIIIEE